MYIMSVVTTEDVSGHCRCFLEAETVPSGEPVLWRDLSDVAQTRASWGPSATRPKVGRLLRDAWL